MVQQRAKPLEVGGEAVGDDGVGGGLDGLVGTAAGAMVGCGHSLKEPGRSTLLIP